MLSLDVMDISGDHQGDLSHNIQKTRVSKEGYELETLKTGGECDASYSNRRLLVSAIPS